MYLEKEDITKKMVSKKKTGEGRQEDKPVDREGKGKECGGHMAGKVTLTESAPGSVLHLE
jgi:hypothetical protein